MNPQVNRYCHACGDLVHSQGVDRADRDYRTDEGPCKEPGCENECYLCVHCENEIYADGEYEVHN